MNKGEFFINKYKVGLTTKHAEIKPSDLRTFFKPKANANIVGSRWKVHNHYKFKEKPTKFNKWLDKSFGEDPVMYDEDAAERIKTKMHKYLGNIGFFNSKVSYTLNYRKKSVDLLYSVTPSKPYHISQISYDVQDSVLRTFFNKKLHKTLVKEGDIYNAYTFDDERDRITKLLRDEGYYYFNRNFIQFIVDSAFNKHEMTIVLKINNVKENTKDEEGEFMERDHRRYFIKNIYVIPDWKPSPLIQYDTVDYVIDFWNDETDYTYNFLLDEKKRIKPSAFHSALKIKPYNPYSATSTQKTYRGLFNFAIIRSATITYDTTGAGSSKDGTYDYMNTTVQMQTAKVNSFQVELEGTNSSGDLGIRGGIIFSNRNIFKKGEIFSVRVIGGFEAQSIKATYEGTNQVNSVFNTFEAGVSGNFYFPRFLFAGRLTRFNQRYNPTTNINFGFNYQVRPDYSRNITNLDLSYSWNLNPQMKNILTLININYVNVFPTDSFQKEIDDHPNPRLREQYSDHLIAGFSYSYIFNNQNLKTLQHFNYLRTNFETSGNLLYAANTLLGSTKHPDTLPTYYHVGGVRYAQYIRWNFDFRHYDYFFDKNHSLVFRILFGIAVPYGNSLEVPYEKGYFAGGANDMRGWQFRTLGPGGFSGENDYERVGDIQIEGNAEYRFTIYKPLKGALFVDVGNIWTLRQSSNYPGAQFKWDTWYQQLAVDAGIGIRLDFSFFIFRVDMAIPLVDPAFWITGDQIRIPIEWNRTVYNFGIGYPF